MKKDATTKAAFLTGTTTESKTQNYNKIERDKNV